MFMLFYPISKEQFDFNKSDVRTQYKALHSIDDEFLNERGKIALDAFSILRGIVLHDDMDEVISRYAEWKKAVTEEGELLEEEKFVIEWMGRQFRIS